MANLAFEAIGALFVVVHTADPPSDEEWSQYVAAGVAVVEHKRFLVFTDGGGPGFSQRRHLFESLKGGQAHTAVVSGNAFVRRIVTALSVFNYKVKVFAPESVEEAYRYLSVTEAESKAIARVLKKLRATLGHSRTRSAGR